MNTFNRPHQDYRNDQTPAHSGEHQSPNTAYYGEIRINNRGKGPRNYKRRDIRVEEDINERLLNDPYLDATEIIVSVKDGEVTLSGTVPDQWSRRQAEYHAQQVGGVVQVQNSIQLPASQTSAETTDPEFTGNDETQLQSFRENLKGHHSP